MYKILDRKGVFSNKITRNNNKGMQMYTAIVEQGVEARMCCFKGENHDLSRTGKPLHREEASPGDYRLDGPVYRAWG